MQKHDQNKGNGWTFGYALNAKRAKTKLSLSKIVEIEKFENPKNLSKRFAKIWA